MAKSKSQKKLDHKLKNQGGVDPRMKRGEWGMINGVSKSTPKLVELQSRRERKHKKRNYVHHLNKMNSSASCVIC